MPYVDLSPESPNRDSSGRKVNIMIFTEGTVLCHKDLINLLKFATYIPIGDCINKIGSWERQGAEIIYCTSRRSKVQVAAIAEVLKRHGFPGSRLYYRGKGERYKHVIEAVIPDILIEDDCKSIGGIRQMCITHVRAEIKAGIKSVVVSEFKGIDDLPGLLSDL